MDIINPEQFFRDFPRLNKAIKPTSPDTKKYNCIAWAVGVDERPWWPGAKPDMYWPPGFPEESTLSVFKATFASLGYELCDDGNIESGYEKIVLYAKGNEPTHAARQLKDGRWWSKCGKNVDIVHNLEELEGPCYGNVAMFFRRPLLHKGGN